MKKIIFLLISFLTMTLIYSCSDNEPEDNNIEKIEYKDISYGSSKSQKIDMMYPDFPSKIKEPLNVILFIHGGGWTDGDKDVYYNHLKFFSENLKMLAVSMNYRMFGEKANCSDMLNDIHSVISFIKTKAQKENITLNKIVLMGASAGGHLTLLYSYKNHAVSPIPIAFCVSESAPVDFTDANLYADSWWDMSWSASSLTGKDITVDDLQNIESRPSVKDALSEVSPINYIKRGIPPTIFAHGRLDELVPFSNAERFLDKLNSTNGIVFDFIEYKKTGHDLGQTTEKDIQEQYNNKLMEYIGKYLMK